LTNVRVSASIEKSIFDMSDDKQKESTINGTITEALPNTMFRVLTESGTEVLAYLSGKMRIHRIKVLVGDRVALEDNPYGGKLRIVKRM
jgi:translation initiation factor IF-1